MAGVVDSVLSGLVERVIQLASDEIGLLAGVKEEVGKLKTTLNMINDVLADAEQKQSEYRSVRTWLQELYEVVYDAEDVLDEFATDAAAAAHPLSPGGEKKKRRFLICRKVRNLFSRHRTGHGIREIRSRLDAIARDRAALGIQLVPGLTSRSDVHKYAPPREPTSGSMPFQEFLVPRTHEKEIIMGWLFSSGSGDGLHIVAVVGMGGMGKTTLAQSVYSDDRVKEFFQVRMWVCVATTDFNVLRITREMVSSLPSDNIAAGGARVGDENLDALQRRLEESVSGKRFLLVLDDVWGLSPNWGDLFKPLRAGKGGSRVVVTTRIEDVAAGMRADGVLNLGRLSEEDALSILRNNAGVATHDGLRDERRERLCEGISKKLGGSPLAAKVIGRLLYSRFNDLAFWESLLTSSALAGRRPDDLEGGGDLLPVLKLSYDRLSPNLKECFAYCSLFPKDYMFHGQMLVRLWMAQGFVRSGSADDHPGLPMEYWGDRHLEDLVSFSLLERRVRPWDGSTVYVMHDLIHDLAVSVSRDYYYAVPRGDKALQPAKIPEKVRHLSWIVDPASPLASGPDEALLSRYEKLRTLLFLNPDVFVSNYWFCDFDFDDFLDKGVCDKLRRLRVLGLRGSPVKSLPASIGRLKHLRRLDLSKTFVRQLPESLGSLRNLLVLNLDECTCVEELPQSLGGLASLRDLALHRTRINKLPPSVTSLSNLQHLVLADTPVEELPESLGSCSNLRLLCLNECRHLKQLPHSVCKLGNLEVLSMDMCVLVEELPPISVGDLANLKLLRLSSTAIKRLPESLGGLPKLEVLELGGCRSLEQVPPQSIGSLGNLRELHLQMLPCLHDLPQSVCNLANLECLNLSSTPIKRLPDALGRLLNLRALLLGWCQCLEELPQSVGYLTNLQSLSLSATRIRVLPESLGNLYNLQELTLGPSQSLEKLPQSLYKLHKLQVLDLDHCPRLSTLPERISQLVDLRQLKAGDQLLCTISHPEGMTALQHLATAAHPRQLKHLNELQSLRLYNLDQVRSRGEAEEARLQSKPQLSSLQLHFSNCSAGEDELRPQDDVNIANSLLAATSAGDAAAADDDDTAPPRRHEEVLEGLRAHIPRIQELKIRGYQGVRSPGWMLDPRIHQGFPSMEEMVFENAPRWEGECWGYSWSHSTAAADNYYDDHQVQTQLTPLPRLAKLRFSNCPRLQWPSPAALLLMEEKREPLLLLSSSLRKLDVKALFTGTAEDDRRVSYLSSCLQQLTRIEKLYIEATFIRSSTSQLLYPTSTVDPAPMTAATLLSPPGAEVLQPFTSLRELSISNCPALSPFCRCLATIDPPMVPLPASSTDLPAPVLSEQREQPQRGPLFELTFERTPPELISRLLRVIGPLLCPWDLIIRSCYELRSFGDAGIDEHAAPDSNSATTTTASTTDMMVGRELEEALLVLAPSLSRLYVRDCPNLRSLPSKLSHLSKLEKLSVDGSPLIESLPEAGLPSSLQKLHITGCCHELVQRCLEGGLDWPKMSHIPDYRIDMKSDMDWSPLAGENTTTPVDGA